MTALITGIGWVGAAGLGAGGDGSPFLLPPGRLPKLTRRLLFRDPDQRFGRLDEFSKLGLAAVTMALRDAGLEEWSRKRAIGVIAQTVYGCLRTDAAYFETVIPDGGAMASPQLFAYTLPNTFLGEAAIRFGLTGATMVVAGSGPGGGDALRLGLRELEWSGMTAVAVGMCDLEAPEDPAPGFLPGALFMVLEREPRPKSAGYGTISLSPEGGISVNHRSAADLTAAAQIGLEGAGKKRRE